MNVNAEDRFSTFAEGLAIANFGGIGGVEKAAHRMEQEGARTTRWIERPLLKWPIEHTLADFLREPVGSIKFAEEVPLFRIDQRFIETLEDIVLDVAQTEASDPRTDASNKIIAVGGREYPVKEIRFYPH